MILVDTSVWIDHLRRGNNRLSGLLHGGEVLCHPFILGELACGNLSRRERILRLLQALPKADLAEQEEVLHLLDTRKLFGKGLGWIDAHLLGSCLLTGCSLWTLDKPLLEAGKKLGATP